MGFLRRNLPVPVPEAPSIDELNEMLEGGCDRVDARSRNREGKAAVGAFREDLTGMPALPGAAFDAVRRDSARADRRGCVRVDGNLCCAGPMWHDRELVVGMRARTVEMLADRGRHVATPPRSFAEGELVRSPVSLIPAPLARPRASGESTIKADMPKALVDAMGRLDKAGRRKALRVLERVAQTSGFETACAAEERVFAGGRIPDEASCDMLARRMAAGAPDGDAGPDLAVYDGFPPREAM